MFSNEHMYSMYIFLFVQLQVYKAALLVLLLENGFHFYFIDLCHLSFLLCSFCSESSPCYNYNIYWFIVPFPLQCIEAIPSLVSYCKINLMSRGSESHNIFMTVLFYQDVGELRPWCALKLITENSIEINMNFSEPFRET